MLDEWKWEWSISCPVLTWRAALVPNRSVWYLPWSSPRIASLDAEITEMSILAPWKISNLSRHGAFRPGSPKGKPDSHVHVPGSQIHTYAYWHHEWISLTMRKRKQKYFITLTMRHEGLKPFNDYINDNIVLQTSTRQLKDSKTSKDSTGSWLVDEAQ